jgi:hypothetical protein
MTMVHQGEFFMANLHECKRALETGFGVDLGRIGAYPLQEYITREFPKESMTSLQDLLPGVQIAESTPTEFIEHSGVHATIGNQGIYYADAIRSLDDTTITLLHELTHLVMPRYAGACDVHTFYDLRTCNTAIPIGRDEGFAESIARLYGRQAGYTRKSQVYHRETEEFVEEIAGRGINTLQGILEFALDDRQGTETVCKDPGTLRHTLLGFMGARNKKIIRVCGHGSG